MPYRRHSLLTSALCLHNLAAAILGVPDPCGNLTYRFPLHSAFHYPAVSSFCFFLFGSDLYLEVSKEDDACAYINCGRRKRSESDSYFTSEGRTLQRGFL